MICQRIGQYIKIIEKEFKNDKGEIIPFFKIMVADEDAVTDEQSIETYAIKADEAQALKGKEAQLVGKNVVLTGRITPKYYKNSQSWVKIFKVETVKLHS